LARPDRIGRDELIGLLQNAGCVAAEEEADELIEAARDADHLSEMATRRATGEPLAWIVGEVTFCGARVIVHPGVYVPRWQSEELARRAARHLSAGELAIDLCTGSGALAVALRALVPGVDVLVTELDERAAECARANGLQVYLGDLDAALPNALVGTAKVVMGVVPYVPTPELQFLPRDVREYEPLLALDGGDSGTVVLFRAARAAKRLLRSGGMVVFELGGDEDDALLAELDRLDFRDGEVFYDEDGDVRGVAAFRR
jgi:release factor glutamine methyltransferase